MTTTPHKCEGGCGRMIVNGDLCFACFQYRDEPAYPSWALTTEQSEQYRLDNEERPWEKYYGV